MEPSHAGVVILDRISPVLAVADVEAALAF